MSKSILTEQEIIGFIREEWEKKMKALSERLDELDTSYTMANGVEKETLSRGLKIKHSESGLLYTVIELGMNSVVLKSPTGLTLAVDHDVIEKEYELD